MYSLTLATEFWCSLTYNFDASPPPLLTEKEAKIAKEKELGIYKEKKVKEKKGEKKNPA